MQDFIPGDGKSTGAAGKWGKDWTLLRARRTVFVGSYAVVVTGNIARGLRLIGCFTISIRRGISERPHAERTVNSFPPLRTRGIYIAWARLRKSLPRSFAYTLPPSSSSLSSGKGLQPQYSAAFLYIHRLLYIFRCFWGGLKRKKNYVCIVTVAV